MKQHVFFRLSLLFLVFILLSAQDGPLQPAWGFFAHKRINRLAVLTLPPDMMVFFKPHIDYLTDHAVDPDMRRYASKTEAPKHFIDMDNYGVPPFENLPRAWMDAMIQYTDLWMVNAAGDTTEVFGRRKPVPENLQKAYKSYFARQVLSHFYRDEQVLEVDSLDRSFIPEGNTARPVALFYREHLSEHGILPWNLQKMQRELTDAFRNRNSKRILRLAGDMGHYIGDAHVPLHTTSNYNGQKTGQHGIHGFWESRIPELFADESYDYFIGKPEYINNTSDFFWSAVLASNSMVDSVLSFERVLRRSFPADRQMCPDLRNGVSVLAPCRDYSAAYQDKLQNMIERRMRAAIHAVSSAWYTAWVDAGQPDLSKMDPVLESDEDRKADAALKKMFESGQAQGRPEDN